MSTEPLLERFGKGREDKVVGRGDCGEYEELAHVIQVEEVKVQVPHDVEIEKEMGVESPWLIIRWGRNKIVDPFIVILRRGLAPKQLSISAALGLTLGVFPVYVVAESSWPSSRMRTRSKGSLMLCTILVRVTVLLCAIMAALLRSNCHVPTLMLANLVATPLEIGLLVPFLRLGEWVTHGEHFPLTSDALWKAITGHASHAIIYGLLHALIGWAIMAPVLLGGNSTQPFMGINIFEQRPPAMLYIKAFEHKGPQKIS
eukprot:Gb_16977 [translate_table: standard]